MPKSNWKIYLALVVILSLLSNGKGFLARAATIEKIEIGLNKKISVTGACNGDILNVQIFSTTSSQPFYTAGADCDENKFEFKDSLGYWNISDGEYKVMIFDKDNNMASSSNTAAFKIDSEIRPAIDTNTAEQAVTTEGEEVKIESTDQKAEIADQTADSEKIPNGIFTEIINAIIDWLKSAIVMIKELVVEKVTTPELCLGGTCITEDQLKNLLGSKQKIEASVSEQEMAPPIDTAASSSDASANITN